MRRYLLGLLLCSSSMMAQDVNTDFQAFRKDMLGNYSGFRKSVLDDYANYLNGIWEEFQVFRGVKRSEAPKPTNIPKVEDAPSKPAPQSLPRPENTPVVKPMEENKPSIKPAHPLAPSVPTVTLGFYGMELNVVSANPCSLSSIAHQDIAKVWKAYQEDSAIKNAMLSLTQLMKDYRLNDWFMYELVSKYAAQVLHNATSSAQVLLEHYMLVNMGYDVRLASTNARLLLLIPFNQQVYERSYLVLDGKKYYIFGEDSKKIQTSSLYTCELPKEVDKGRGLNLVLGKRGLGIISSNQHHYQLTDGSIQVQGTVNTGTMEALRHYPQMDVVYYAISVVNPVFREELLAQIKPQIVGLSQRDAANKLLHFVQYAFDYATDQEQFGYEKPYFLEENFYYPKNDCEDRAVLYATLVHELLGLDVHLVQYPGHECTAVHFTDNVVTGDGYEYQGKTYLICDPTYIGASIGCCMPNFRSVKPKIATFPVY